MTPMQIQNVRAFLKDSGYTYTEDWLTECLDWIKESYPQTQFTLDFLKKTIHGQWIDSDLTEMECKCLPPNLSDQKFIMLKGKYGLQINSIRDIGESSYTQYTKLKRLENENTNVMATDSNEFKPSWEPKPRRTLHLTLTDGTQTIFGLEHTTLPRLDLFTKPGAKIVVKGPVECRRGTLLLKPANVNVIGGVVESLVNKNSAINVLSRQLNLEEGNEDITSFPTQIPNTQDQSQTQNQTQYSFVNASTHHQSTLQTQTLEAEEPDAFDDADDALFIGLDESALIRESQQQSLMQERNSTSLSNNSSRSNSRPSTSYNDESTHLLTNPNERTGSTAPFPAAKRPRTGTTTKANTSKAKESTSNKNNGKKKGGNLTLRQQKISFFLRPIPHYAREIVEPFDEDDDEFLALISEEFERGATTANAVVDSQEPYRFIKDIGPGFCGSIKVKACISTLLSKFHNEKNDKWAIKVSINDGSAFLSAHISHEVLHGIIGFTPSQIKAITGGNDQKKKAETQKNLCKVQEMLVNLNAILTLQISPPADPIVTNITEINAEHVAQLKARLARLN